MKQISEITDKRLYLKQFMNSKEKSCGQTLPCRHLGDQYVYHHRAWKDIIFNLLLQFQYQLFVHRTQPVLRYNGNSPHLRLLANGCKQTNKFSHSLATLLWNPKLNCYDIHVYFAADGSIVTCIYSHCSIKKRKDPLYIRKCESEI